MARGKTRGLTPIERFAKQNVTREEMVDAINLALNVYDRRRWQNRARRRINKLKNRTKAGVDHWILAPLYRTGERILSWRSS